MRGLLESDRRHTMTSHVFDKLQALGHYAFARQIESADTSPGGILLPATARKSPPYWILFSHGPDFNKAKVGDRILFKDGIRIEHEGRVICALRPEDVLATLPVPEEVPVKAILPDMSGRA